MNTKQYTQQIFQTCALSDRRRLLRLTRELKSTKDSALRQNLEQSIQKSVLKVASRTQNRPVVTLNQNLPFYEKREELKQIISENQVVIVCGETGSGKTTQLPQICIDLGLADKGKIGHTQPRRLAARSVTDRIAEELKSPPGEAVGFKVRFTDTTRPDSYVKLMTDGILLAEIQGDRWLSEYQTIIIDEAHERSLNIDLILGFLKTLLPKRPDLKLIITSATIDPQRFSRYFYDAPMVLVSGRTYPVDILYRPVLDEEQKDRDMTQAVIDALDELFTQSPEDTLIFFPGERQIRDAAEKISKRFHNYEVLPLYARLTHEQQQKIFKKSARRKIILSTNVAETSLTVPGIRYVIDTGQARISRYSWRAKVQRLPIEKISQASANQRSGRCGRIAAGTCIRLYDEDDFNQRSEFTEPEILRTNLASVILQMDNLRAGHIRDFDFIQPPDSRLISDGYRLLNELQAVTKEDHVTPMGKQISRLSIDPRLARMLIHASANGCLNEVLIIAAVLSVQDPRDQSQDNRQAANMKFKLWQDEQSDFLSWINLWQTINQQKKELTRGQFTKWCKKNYLSWMRLREWQDIYKQIKEQIKQLKLTFNTTEASAENIHRSLLMGIPSHLANLNQENEYQTTRGRIATIFPSSVLANKKPKWIMAFSLLDTSRLFAHVVSGLNPQWVMSDLQHLHQYEYYQPHWQEKQARVAALRNTRIYGLLVEGGKRINYARVNPKESREIFIREALVEGFFKTHIEFINANRKLIEFYRQQEERERRRDLLIGEQQLYEFYDQHIPDSCVDGVSFNSWAKKLPAEKTKQLTLFEQDVLATDHKKDLQTYPENLKIKNQTLKLSYVFDPSDDADGVSAWIPLAVLNQFEDSDFDFLVPGLLEEKVQAIIKSLPKLLRKNFIPVPDFAHACLQLLDINQPLLQQLSKHLQRMTGVQVKASDWNLENIDAHFKMRYCIEKDGTCIASGRSLIKLKGEYTDQANLQFEQQAQHDDIWARQGITEWDFDSLPAQVSIAKKGSRIIAFPALVDYTESVSIELLETKQDAHFYHATGIARLVYLRLKPTVKYLYKKLPHINESALMYVSIGGKIELIEDIIISSIFDCFITGPLPKSSQEFEQLIDKNESRFLSIANDKSDQVYKSLSLYREARNQLHDAKISTQHRNDCMEQCNHLIYEGFVRDIPSSALNRLPNYFQALIKRLDKMSRDVSQADRALPMIRKLWARYLTISATESDSEVLEKIRWMIEELRITSFAQPMKARIPVSEQKITKLMDALN